MTEPVRVALIGANGHGRWHRRRIAPDPRVRLVGLADPQPIDPDPPVPEGVALFTDYREMLSTTAPSVVVICTPPHTHLPIALDALDAGCDLLLEKPPVASLAAHRTLAAQLNATGRSCQVGFQALGSQAWARFRAAVASGPASSVSALASWQRDDAYYARAPWAGRRTVDGRPVIDGSLVNPLAHAMMQALATASAAGGGRPKQVAVERYRTRPAIEVDDTAFARVTFDSGLTVTIAVTLAGEEFIAGQIDAVLPTGPATLEYPTDRLALPGEPAAVPIPARTDLLTNLLDHRDTGVPLMVPLEATRDFTAVLEALTEPDIPTPALIEEKYLDHANGVRIIRGVNALARQATRSGSLPSELGVSWAASPYVRRVPLG
jgi:predicted dehydrogenase